ncbi:MAG TPA: c-type cytochrome [Candidatus Sulfotelmatobacter sp.]|jgi:mono/diheme cytochrome c family protein
MCLRAISFDGALVAIICVLCLPGFAQSEHADAKKSAARSSQPMVDRGRYIAEDLAVCGQCHTPRDDQGNLDRSKWLEGAPLWLNPARPTQGWPLQAPRIAGDPPGTDAEMIKLLTTGIWRDGKPLRAPMPQFHMSVSDAQAVLAYLKSLTPQH